LKPWKETSGAFCFLVGTAPRCRAQRGPAGLRGCQGTARSSTGLRGGSTLLRSCDGKLVFLAALRASNILGQFPSRPLRTCVSLIRPSATVSSLAVPDNRTVVPGSEAAPRNSRSF